MPKLTLEEMNKLQEHYKKVFELVENKQHWKGPINIDVDMRSNTFKNITTDDIASAISFFTATEARIIKIGFLEYNVTAPGYWAGPAN